MSDLRPGDDVTVGLGGADDVNSMRADRVLLVSGYLGSGKSHLARLFVPEGASVVGFAGGAVGVALIGDERVSVIEGSALSSPTLPVADDRYAGLGLSVVTVVDAVNFPGLVDDAAISGLVESQVRAADLIWLTRGDIGDAAATRQAVAAMSDAPVLEAVEGHGPDDILAALPAPVHRDIGAPGVDLTWSFSVWQYSGASVLTAAALDAFLANRPRGTWRVKGQALAQEGGHNLDVFGRGRQIQPLDDCETTEIWACGPSDRFERREMDLAFAEAVMASSYNRGLIACR